MMLNDIGKTIVLTTFSIGIRHYIDKVIPNNKIHYNSIETLLSRVFGKPKESADIKQDTEITIKFANGDYPTDSTRGAEKSITEQGEV